VFYTVTAASNGTDIYDITQKTPLLKVYPHTKFIAAFLFCVEHKAQNIITYRKLLLKKQFF